MVLLFTTGADANPTSGVETYLPVAVEVRAAGTDGSREIFF